MEIFQEVKLEIYIPPAFLDRLREALHQAGAGHIGPYDHCLSVTVVEGYWRPLEQSSPYSGTIGKVAQEKELKVEVRCQRAAIRKTLSAIRQVHPYEEPLINVIPLITSLDEEG